MLSLALDVALACGGLFCDGSSVPPQTIPVQQTEEAVVFAVDPVANTTTMHVQISYEGPVSEFAWILPVAGVPELQRSSERLFTQLAAATRETWTRTDRADSSCFSNQDFATEGDSDADADTDTDSDTDADADVDTDVGVTVVATSAVGPYDTAVLTATSSEALLEWLNDNGYQVPAGLEPVLAPYVAPGMHFVALKLQKDRDAGDLEPLALTYPGTKPSIPMQLTAIAAADDMPLFVYLLGSERAFPENYLHVERNLLRADWPEFPGIAYDGQEELLARATDAAGGQAFATLFAGPVAPFGSDIYDLQPFLAEETLDGWLGRLSVLPALTSAEMAQILPAPPETIVAADLFFGCPSCYPSALDAIDYDAEIFTARLDEIVVEPLERINKMMVEGRYVSKLGTALSPSEMTLDPTFTFVAGQPDVSSDHVLDTFRDCGTRTLERTHYEIDVDGWTFRGPTAKKLEADGLTLLQWIADQYEGDILTVQEVSAGSLHTLVDNRDQLPVPSSGGGQACGCDHRSSVATLTMLPLLALAWRRRRNRSIGALR